MSVSNVNSYPYNKAGSDVSNRLCGRDAAAAAADDGVLDGVFDNVAQLGGASSASAAPTYYVVNGDAGGSLQYLADVPRQDHGFVDEHSFEIKKNKMEKAKVRRCKLDPGLESHGFRI